GGQALDPFDGRLDRFGVGRCDLHGAVVLDIDLGPGLFDDFADDLAAGADDVADLVGRDGDLNDARRVGAHAFARRVQRLVHFTEDVHAPGVRAVERHLHDFLGDAGDLDVHLQRGDALFGAGHLEVHVAEVVFIAEDVGQHFETVILEDEAHGD